MKKAILTAMLVLSMATAAFAGTEEDQINPQRAKLEQLNKEVQEVNQDAVVMVKSTLQSVGGIALFPFELVAFPHRYIEPGDEYAQAIPGTFGRYAARAGLAIPRLACVIPALPYLGIKAIVDAVH